MSDHRMILVRFGGRDFPSLQETYRSDGLEFVDSLDEVSDVGSVEAAIGNIGSREFYERATSLRWVQSMSAGVNAYPLDLIASRNIVLTNAAGVYGSNIADHTMALALMLVRQIEPIRRDVLRDGWPKQKRLPDPGELAGQTMLVVGLGGIGEETARRAFGLGMRVIATRRHTDRPKPDFVESVHDPADLHQLLPDADWVAVCVPYTDHTIDLISTPEFDAMKPGAYILCATRGGIINTESLMSALDSGKLAGAGLDVTDPEPLPLEHPLWKYENVIITPHQSGYSVAADRRLEDLIRHNIDCFLHGGDMQNIVNLELQY